MFILSERLRCISVSHTSVCSQISQGPYKNSGSGSVRSALRFCFSFFFPSKLLGDSYLEEYQILLETINDYKYIHNRKTEQAIIILRELFLH